MNDSVQHKLKRVRPPRVKISYDVEIGDAVEKRELPFVGALVGALVGDMGKLPVPPSALSAISHLR